MSPPHYLYVIAAEAHPHGPCKLGVSADPDQRLRRLQTGHPDRLRVYHREPVDADKVKTLEKLLHRDLHHTRQRGEWFALPVADAVLHVQFTVIQYDSVSDLDQKFRQRRI